MKFSNSYLKEINLLSKIFQPVNVVPKNAVIKKQDITSNSQRLMLDLGIIRQANPGCFHYLPLGMRALQKLTNIIDNYMIKLGAQKVAMPSLTSAKLWKTTGRIETAGNELFILRDRHQKEYVLSPTHEESVSDLLASISPVSYKQCPLRLYQISSKYRDEIKPRFGLMRSRQFIMKDLYTFDIDISNAKKTYEEVCGVYDQFFNHLKIKYVKVLGTMGNIGGSISHEYQFPSEIGEDRIFLCKKCHYSANIELSGTEKCPKCHTAGDGTVISAGIEVGHTFLLGEKYSAPLKSKVLGVDGKPSVLQMGSYGLGVSRILAAAVEVLSSENAMRWPVSIAPYSVAIIPPKGGSKEEPFTGDYSNQIYSSLEEQLPVLKGDVLIDDRTQLTIGKRLIEAKRVGYPLIIVVGGRAKEHPPTFELHDLSRNTQFDFTHTEIYNYIEQKMMMLH